VDFLQRKMKVNEGEVPQYYVTDSHPAIISKKDWNAAQAEMLKRKSKGKHQNSLSPFSSKIICGDCGEYYGSKVWHSTDKYRRVIWQCNGKYKREKKCETPHLYEDDIKCLFLKAVSELLADRSTLIGDCEAMVGVLKDTSEFDAEIAKLEAEMDEIGVLTERLINRNASVAISQADYNRQYDAYTERFNKAKSKCDKLKGRKVSRAFEADVPHILLVV
jgi:site-specific DNA recombinase